MKSIHGLTIKLFSRLHFFGVNFPQGWKTVFLQAFFDLCSNPATIALKPCSSVANHFHRDASEEIFLNLLMQCQTLISTLDVVLIEIFLLKWMDFQQILIFRDKFILDKRCEMLEKKCKAFNLTILQLLSHLLSFKSHRKYFPYFPRVQI